MPPWSLLHLLGFTHTRAVLLNDPALSNGTDFVNAEVTVIRVHVPRSSAASAEARSPVRLRRLAGQRQNRTKAEHRHFFSFDHNPILSCDQRTEGVSTLTYYRCSPEILFESARKNS